MQPHYDTDSHSVCGIKKPFLGVAHLRACNKAPLSSKHLHLTALAQQMSLRST